LLGKVKGPKFFYKVNNINTDIIISKDGGIALSGIDNDNEK